MKIAVITGASSGLGREYAAAAFTLCPELDEVWALARRRERLEELRAELGEKLRIMAVDITDGGDVESYRAQLEESGADVRLLINNAGFGRLGNFDGLSVQDNAGMVRLNCEALTVISSVTLPFMHEGAGIINVCSIASFAPTSRMAVYCSTKAYVFSLSRAMRIELKTRGINVLAVCPGPMETEFLSVANIPKGVSKTFDSLPRTNPAVLAKKSLLASKKRRAVYTGLPLFKLYRVIAKILPHSIVMRLCGT